MAIRVTAIWATVSIHLISDLAIPELDKHSYSRELPCKTRGFQARMRPLEIPLDGDANPFHTANLMFGLLGEGQQVVVVISSQFIRQFVPESRQ